MQLTRILREGFIAGLIGAGAVALWFLVVDVIAGRPFFTPAMLGSAVFFGETDPSKAVIAFSRVVPYTMIHVCAFIIVGTVAAALAAEVEVAPPTLYLIVVTFAVFEFGFYIMLAVLAQPLLGALTWWNVAIGNAIAAYGMGRRRIRTRNAECGTRNRRTRVSCAVPRSAFRLLRFRTLPRAPLSPPHRAPLGRPTGTIPRSPPPTGRSYRPPT